jgi:hypothetical protein
MFEKKFLKALEIIHKRFKKNNIKWALVGSANMRLQGMDVFPNDLDVVVSLQDLEKVSSIFSDFDASSVQELNGITDCPAWEVKVNIGDVDVQILAENTTGWYGRELACSKLINIRLGEIVIPCFSLDIDARVYEEINQKHKADMIRKFLRSS